MDQQETSPQPPPRPVMDIRPQRPVVQPANRPTRAPIDRTRYTAPTLSQASAVPTSPSVPVATPPAQAEQPTPPQPVEVPETKAAESHAPQPQPPIPPTMKAPVAAIVAAVIVGFALSALTVFAFLKEQKKETANHDNKEHTQVQPEEIDASTKSIDDEINTLNDSTDFNSTELNDQTLGL